MASLLRGSLGIVFAFFAFGLFVSPVSAATTIYSSEFNSDPGWTTDQPENFYWQASTSALFGHIVNTPPAPHYKPNRYIVKQTDLDPNRDFRLTWELFIPRIYDNGTVMFGLYAPDLVSQNRTSIFAPKIISQSTVNIKLSSFGNTYRNFDLNILSDDGSNLGSGGSGGDRWFEPQVWYEMGIEHNVASSTIRMWMIDKETSRIVHNRTFSVLGYSFDPLMQYVGVSMYPDGEPFTPMAQTAARLAGSSDFLIDNVVLTQDPFAEEPELDPLILQYEPILYFHEDEDFYPMNVEPFVETSALWSTEGVGDTQLQPEGSVTTATISGPDTEDWYLAFSTPDEAKSFDSGAAKEKYDQLVTADRAVSTYYAHKMEQGDWTVLQYWYFYAFNNWKEHEGFNNHEGDWESVFVFLDRETEEPEYVAFSAHHNDGSANPFLGQYDSVRRSWSGNEVTTSGDSVVSYVAAGSHANYPNEGEHEVPILLLRFKDKTSSAGVQLSQSGWEHRRLISDGTPSWMQFAGRWGTDRTDAFEGESGARGPNYSNVSGTVRFQNPVGWAGLDKISTKSGDGAETSFSFLNQLTRMFFSEPVPEGETVTSDQHDELITFGNLEEVNLLPRFWDFSTTLPNSSFEVDVELGYTDEEVEALGLSEEKLSVFLYDEENSIWNAVGSLVDTLANTISFNTTHFSRYAIGQLVVTNEPPVLDSIGDQTVGEGDTLEFTISATDPDVGDTLTYAAANLPEGASFDPETRTFYWNTDYDDAGNYTDIEFTVTDDGEPLGLDVELITITVGDVNRAPVFENPGPQEVLEDEQLDMVISALDPDGNTVELAALNLPERASFSTSTGEFTWKPTRSQEGVYVLTFMASDDGEPQSTSTLDVVITVGDNPTPVELADQLIALVLSYQLPQEIENAYLANLKKVPTFIEEGNITPAIQQLAAFMQKVEMDYKKGKIDVEMKNSLTDFAEELSGDLVEN